MVMLNLLVYILILVAVSAQSLPYPKLIRISKLKTAINSFGISLFVELFMVEHEFNFVISPYSLSNSLGMLHFLSVNKTEKELANVLGYKAVNLTKDEVAHTFYLFSTRLLQNSKPKVYTFNTSSTIVFNRNIGRLPTFKGEVEVLFQVPIIEVDFTDSGDEMVRSLNDWVPARKKKKIRNVTNHVDASSGMIVLNAAYFKGVWRHKFPLAESKLGVFYNHGLKFIPKEVHMMRMTRILNFHKGENQSIVELPFKGQNARMIILLPRKLDGYIELLEEFSPDFLETKISLMSRSMTHIALPKFKIEYSGDIKKYLKSLGVRKLFHPHDRVYHKTFVSVTENGVDAVNATETEKLLPQISMQETPDFLVDRPFLFVIYERKMHMVLFVGFVVEL